MPREKVVRRGEREVIYDEERWELLRAMRRRARDVMAGIGESWFVHGSVARGDVDAKSDVDIVIPSVIPSYTLECALDGWVERTIVQATPNSVPKVTYQIDEVTSITFPLVEMSEREEMFYVFSGRVYRAEEGVRVRGVDKRLMMIEPTPRGHREWSIIGREAEVAAVLGVPLQVVEERVRVLTRRDRIGRTGVYLKVAVPEGEGVERFFRRLADRDPALRRVLRR